MTESAVRLRKASYLSLAPILFNYASVHLRAAPWGLGQLNQLWKPFAQAQVRSWRLITFSRS